MTTVVCTSSELRWIQCYFKHHTLIRESYIPVSSFSGAENGAVAIQQTASVSVLDNVFARNQGTPSPCIHLARLTSHEKYT